MPLHTVVYLRKYDKYPKHVIWPSLSRDATSRMLFMDGYDCSLTRGIFVRADGAHTHVVLHRVE